MVKQEEKQEYTIDASKKNLGRVASEVAILLMGKNRTDFVRRSAPNVTVTIENASKIKISPRKERGKVYVWNTGYPGGKREETLGHRLERKGYEDIFRKAVFGMLPSNRLRPVMMKKLIIKL